MLLLDFFNKRLKKSISEDMLLAGCFHLNSTFISKNVIPFPYMKKRKAIHKIGSINNSLSIYTKTNSWSFDYQLQEKNIYKWNMTLNNCFICKIISGVSLSGNAPGNIKCPYFVIIILPKLKNCKWLKRLCICNANGNALWSLNCFTIGKIIVFSLC